MLCKVRGASSGDNVNVSSTSQIMPPGIEPGECRHPYPDIIIPTKATTLILEVGVTSNTRKALMTLRERKFNTYRPLISMLRGKGQQVRFAVIPVGAVGRVMPRTLKDVHQVFRGGIPRAEHTSRRILTSVGSKVARKSLILLATELATRMKKKS